MGRGPYFLVAVLNSDIVALIGLHKGQRREKGEGARGIHKGQGEATKKQVGAVRLATYWSGSCWVRSAVTGGGGKDTCSSSHFFAGDKCTVIELRCYYQLVLSRSQERKLDKESPEATRSRSRDRERRRDRDDRGDRRRKSRADSRERERGRHRDRSRYGGGGREVEGVGGLGERRRRMESLNGGKFGWFGGR